MFSRKLLCFKCFHHFFCVYNQCDSLSPVGRTRLEVHSMLQVQDRGHKASGPATVAPASPS